MRKITLSLVSAALFFSIARAQQVSGTVKDDQGKGLEKTTVSLLNGKDSSLLKLAVTNSEGKFSLTTGKTGRFLITVSHVGYNRQISKVFEVSGSGEVSLPDFNMVKFSGELKGVTVIAQKPMVEVKADKTVLNVEGTINATGNDALELLRKSPGVMVDKDDNISLAGKNGVQIYIDGKPTPLSGSDLANYLKSLQSAQIESIEIITNPSAKYEAAGNAGIINIKLKKNKAFGTNGSVNLGYNIGITPKYNLGLSLNHRNKNVNVFGNYNYNKSDNVNDFRLYREQLDTIFDGHSKMNNHNNSHGFKTGVDFFINNKNTFGVLLNGNISDNTFNSNTTTPIIYKPTNKTDRLLVAASDNKMKRTNVNFNLNYRYADTSGHELNVDADYGLFRLRSDQLQPNYYYDTTESTLLNQFIYRFIAPTNIDIYSLKSDYEQNFKKGRLGFGFKTALVKTDNNFGRYNVQQVNPETKQLDVPRSNQFNYKENINAAYVNYNKQFKTVMVQFGVRMENTSTTGDSYGLNGDGSVNYGSKQTFKRNYIDFFPSGAITFTKNPKSQWSLSYSRRIDRPAYQDLNPFEFKLDEYTYMKGNTGLRPQYTNIISLTNVYKYKLTTKLSYSHVADVFTQLVDTADKSKAFLTKKNLATQDVTNLVISYPIQYKAYSGFINFTGNYSHYKADFGGGNRVVNLGVTSFNIFMQNSIKIGKKGWTTEMSGWFNSPSIWGGTFKTNSMWDVDAGVQKTVFKGKGNLKFSVTDIFLSQKFTATSNFAGQYLQASGHGESRQLRTSLIWRFGNNKVKAARQRQTGAEDEKNRTQSSGGLGNQ